MDNQNILAKSINEKNLKGRSSNARKSRRRKFERRKKRGKRNPVTNNQHRQQDSDTTQNDKQGLVEEAEPAVSCVSDATSHDADMLDVSGVGELPPDDDDRPNRIMIERCEGTATEDSPNVERFVKSTTHVPPLLPSSAMIRPVGQGRVPQPTRYLLEEVCRRLMMSLPSLWLPILKDEGIHIGLCAEHVTFVVQRSLYISLDGTVSCTVHGKELSPDHSFWKDVRKVALCPESVEEYAKNVLRMVHSLASLEMCPGVEKFKHFWEHTQNCEVDCNRFHEKSYTTTCRANFCTLLFEKRKKKSRCEACRSVFNMFSLRKGRRLKKVTDTHAKNTANSYLNISQHQKRMCLKNAQLRAERQRNIRLTTRIAVLLAKEGLEVDNTTTDDVAGSSFIDDLIR